MHTTLGSLMAFMGNWHCTLALCLCAFAFITLCAHINPV